MKTETADFCRDDGLLTPKVGPWVRTKHQKVGYYSSLFATSMKRRWQCRVYLDLFAGAGKSRIKGTGEVIPGSPLLALSVADPYDKYVFCEQDPGSVSALQSRVERYFPQRDVAYVPGDANSCVDQVLAALPTFSKTYKGLTLCFVDPFKMSQLEFRTLERIANGLYVDFLVLIPTYMDINRNAHVYSQAGSGTVDRYLGSSDWRNRWTDPCRRPSQDFGLFVADEFGNQMKGIGFRYEGLKDMELVRMSDDKNQRLYHLAFFSKNDLGLRFWRETLKNTNAPRLFSLD